MGKRTARRTPKPATEPVFFATPADFRAWLAAHHATATELPVGFRTKASGAPSLTWREAVDEALCFGWIDGVRRRLSATSYTIRFTPRKPGSIWSAINVARVEALESAGRMKPAGRRAFAARKAAKTGVYSFERERPAELTPAEEQELRATPKAAAFFDALPPSYRRKVLHWIVSAKQDATRAQRLARFAASCKAGKRL